MTIREHIGANTVHLAGWLLIDTVKRIPLGYKPPALVLAGEICTRQPETGRERATEARYPVLFTGKPAEIVLDWARTHPDMPVRVAVAGQLYRHDQGLTVRVRFVQVLALPGSPPPKT